MSDVLDRVRGKVVYAEDILELFYAASIGQDKLFIKIVEDIIEDAPAADVAEEKHGRKVESAISNTGLMCTACFSDIDRDAVFCKYCGAKMDDRKS